MNFKKVLKDALTIKFDKAFGLDIGDRSIEIIELEKVFRFSVVTYGRTELNEGIVENGKIIDQKAFLLLNGSGTVYYCPEYYFLFIFMTRSDVIKTGSMTLI